MRIKDKAPQPPKGEFSRLIYLLLILRQSKNMYNILQINIKAHINKFRRKVNRYIPSVESSTLQFFAALSSPHKYTL